MIEIVARITLIAYAVALALGLVRVLRGSLPDRVVALDLLTTVGVCVSGILAVFYGAAWFLDVALVLSLIAFVVTLAFARFVEASA